jgi:hypothetical protein
MLSRACVGLAVVGLVAVLSYLVPAFAAVQVP